VRAFLLAAAFSASLCAQQTEIRGQPDPDQQRRQQEQEERRRNEEARDPYRGWQGLPRSLRIQGKVVMPDGGPPPDSVAVDMQCGEGVRRAWTDSRGLFSFALSAPAPDASAGRTQAPAQRGDAPAGPCRITVQSPGFYAPPVVAGGMTGPQDQRQHLIFLKSVAGVSGFTFSATSLSAPKSAARAYAKGRDLLRNEKPAQAEAELRRAVAAHPNYAAAWYELGRALMVQRRAGEARAAFEQAVKSDPKYINPYPQLARIAFAEKRWDELAAWTWTLIQLNPFFSADIYLFSALANLNINRLDVAEKHAREALRMDGKRALPQAHHILGRVLARLCKASEAAEQLRLYLAGAPSAADADSVRALLTQVESPAFAQGCAASNSQPNPGRSGGTV
jgi:tetratricopeptide (TPR) repeat protein